jgi:hypothetical protein
VYQDGAMTIGVRAGRCVMQGQPIAFAGQTQIALDNNQTIAVWLDDSGAIAVDAGGFPADRTRFVPLAEITTAAGAISTIDDRRGEALLNIPDVAGLGLTATVDQIDQALAGISATVDAAALNQLTGGPLASADTEHRHGQFRHDQDSEAALRLTNDSAGPAANMALYFELSSKLPDVTALLPDPATGWLRQRFAADAYALVGVVHLEAVHEGTLTASQIGRLLGAVPAAGEVTDVVISVGQNIVSDNAADGVAATVKVNGTAVTTTSPQITDAAGPGFRSTAQGDGTPATIKSDGTEQVARGDVLAVDLTRTVNGTVSSEAADLAVLVIIRAAGPE